MTKCKGKSHIKDSRAYRNHKLAIGRVEQEGSIDRVRRLAIGDWCVILRSSVTTSREVEISLQRNFMEKPRLDEPFLFPPHGSMKGDIIIWVTWGTQIQHSQGSYGGISRWHVSPITRWHIEMMTSPPRISDQRLHEVNFIPSPIFLPNIVLKVSVPEG